MAEVVFNFYLKWTKQI